MELKCLIKKEEIEAVRKTHFLNPNANCSNKSLGDLAGLTGFGFHIMEVKPGNESTEYHFHYNEDECVNILSGEGTARYGDEIVSVTEGDFLGYPKGGMAHTIKNTGVELLRCIVVGQRLDSDVVDYPDKNKRIFRTNGCDTSSVSVFSELKYQCIPRLRGKYEQG